MRISISEKDVEIALPDHELATLTKQVPEPVLGEEVPARADFLMRKLPAIVASIVDSTEPKGYEASSFDISVEFSGKPFGIGVSGKGTISYVKKQGSSTDKGQ